MMKKWTRVLALLLALLVLLTGCAATEDPLVKKKEIVKMVDLAQVVAPEVSGTYRGGFSCSVTDPEQFGKAFFGDRPYELQESGYGYRAVSTTDPQEFVLTVAMVRGTQDGKWKGDLQKDIGRITYRKSSEASGYINVFYHHSEAMHGRLKWEMRSASASAEILQAAEQDSARILRELGRDSFQMTFSGGYSPEDFDRFSTMTYQQYPTLPEGHLYVVEYQLESERRPAGIAQHDVAIFLYDESGLIAAVVSSEIVYELISDDVYVPCSAEDAYNAAIADWHEPGAVLVEASFSAQFTSIEDAGFTVNPYDTALAGGYWEFMFVYPMANPSKLEFNMKQLGPYRDQATGCYEVWIIHVDARTCTKMTGERWISSSVFGKKFIHSYNNWAESN